MNEVPEKFKLKSSIRYPKHINDPLIEEYFYNFFKNNELNNNRIYLPIFWTNFYISRQYGKNIDDLREYIKI